MRRFISILAATLLLWGVAAVSDAQEIRDIQTYVTLFENGNANVVQRWDVTVVDGTEYYIPIDNPGKSYIHDLRVMEDGEYYADDGRKWNSDRSREAKTRRCGIVEKRGGDIELCWGLGEYGDHVYIIGYMIDNLVQSYEECDGFHWHFLNDEWTVRPKHVSIEIKNGTNGDDWYWNDENDNNTNFWGFGMDGEAWLENGTLYFESTEPFDYDSFFSALVSFKKGLFKPAVEGEGTFEALKDEAMNGSDYGEKKESFLERMLFWIFIALIIGIPVFFIGGILFVIFRRLYWKVTGRHYDKKVFGCNKISGWYRDVPMDGNPTAFFSLLHSGDLLEPNKYTDFPNLVSAYFLKWIQDGLIAVEPDSRKTNQTNLRFTKTAEEVSFDDVMEGKVYAGALDAAGENRLLEANEFKSWSYKHDELVAGWPAESVQRGRPVWQALSEADRCHAVEFKNFLSDYTLIGERAAPEVALWKQYLVLAASLGIADKVAKSFEKLFPKVMEEYMRETRMMDTATTYYILENLRNSSSSMMTTALSKQNMRRTYESMQSRRSYGGGGSISRGGGHGGFGGGHGGGTR